MVLEGHLERDCMRERDSSRVHVALVVAIFFLLMVIHLQLSLAIQLSVVAFATIKMCLLTLDTSGARYNQVRIFHVLALYVQLAWLKPVSFAIEPNSRMFLGWMSR